MAKKFFLDRRLPDNVWLGTTVEDQAMAELRIPLLLSIPAKVRFLSCEPLLGPIDLTRIQYCRQGFERWTVNALTGALSSDFNNQATPLPSLGWVIAGGESGPKARPSHPDWFRSLRDQCADAGVPFFFKQWGSWYPEIDRDFHDPDWRADYGVADGKRFRIMNLAGGRGFHGERVHLMARKSKASAGAMLDGREHREFPL